MDELAPNTPFAAFLEPSPLSVIPSVVNLLYFLLHLAFVHTISVLWSDSGLDNNYD